MNSQYFKIQREILKIYHELLLHRHDDKIILELYQKYLKLIVQIGTNSPNFIKDYFQYMHGNCYTYALGLPCPSDFYLSYQVAAQENMNFNVGFIGTQDTSELVFFTGEQLLDSFYEDCDILNIKVFPSNINDTIKHGGYKISIFIDLEDVLLSDFHFIRQNANGSWSEKLGYDGKIKLLDSVKGPTKDYQLIRTLEIVKPVIR